MHLLFIFYVLIAKFPFTSLLHICTKTNLLDQVPDSNDGANDHTDTVVCREAVVKDCGGALFAGWHRSVGVGLLEGEVEALEGH